MELIHLIDVLANTDMLRIIKDGADVFVGWLGTFVAEKELLQKYGGQKVKQFKIVTEVRHKRWKELGLMQPLQPEETPDFRFSDLQMKLYYTIYIGN